MPFVLLCPGSKPRSHYARRGAERRPCLDIKQHSQARALVSQALWVINLAATRTFASQVSVAPQLVCDVLSLLPTADD